MHFYKKEASQWFYDAVTFRIHYFWFITYDKFEDKYIWMLKVHETKDGDIQYKGICRSSPNSLYRTYGDPDEQVAFHLFDHEKEKMVQIALNSLNNTEKKP